MSLFSYLFNLKNQNFGFEVPELFSVVFFALLIVEGWGGEWGCGWFTAIEILLNVQNVRYRHPGKFFIFREYKRMVKGMVYFYFTLYGVVVGPGFCGHTIKLWRVPSISCIPCSNQHKRLTLNPCTSPTPFSKDL